MEGREKEIMVRKAEMLSIVGDLDCCLLSSCIANGRLPSYMKKWRDNGPTRYRFGDGFLAIVPCPFYLFIHRIQMGIKSSRCASRIAIVQASDHRNGVDCPYFERLFLSFFWRILIKRKMGPTPMIIDQVTS